MSPDVQPPLWVLPVAALALLSTLGGTVLLMVRRRRRGLRELLLIALAGLLTVLLVLGATAALLASSGARVPPHRRRFVYEPNPSAPVVVRSERRQHVAGLALHHHDHGRAGCEGELARRAGRQAHHHER